MKKSTSRIQDKDKLKTRHYIVSLMCEILLFVLSKGRSSFFLGIFAIILIGMSKMNIIKKIILKFLPFAYWAILGALIFCMFIYARDNGTSAISLMMAFLMAESVLHIEVYWFIRLQYLERQ